VVQTENIILFPPCLSSKKDSSVPRAVFTGALKQSLGLLRVFANFFVKEDSNSSAAFMLAFINPLSLFNRKMREPQNGVTHRAAGCFA
jgi:hypothetical protein